MNTETQIAPRTEPGSLHAKIEAIKPIMSGALIAAPALLLTALMMQSRMAWPHSQMFIVVILAIMAIDFLMLLVLEPYRSTLGKVTIPAMLAFIGMTIMYILTEALNRFVIGFAYGYTWLTPFVALALLAIYAGVFSERHVPLKVFLCVNGLALSVLWCLADAGKMALPF